MKVRTRPLLGMVGEKGCIVDSQRHPEGSRLNRTVRRREGMREEEKRVGRKSKQTKKSLGPRGDPRQSMAKIVGLYRKEKLGEGTEAQTLGWRGLG